MEPAGSGRVVVGSDLVQMSGAWLCGTSCVFGKNPSLRITVDNRGSTW